MKNPHTFEDSLETYSWFKQHDDIVRVKDNSDHYAK